MPADGQSPATHKEIAIGTKESKLVFQLPLRYSEGHVINSVEAKVLNQILAENVGNNFRGKVQAHLEGKEGALTEEQLRSAFDEYVRDYVFTEASAGGSTATLTPLERESRKIASSVVLASLKKQGKARKDIEKEAFEAEVARIAELDPVQDLAKKNLKNLEKIANALQEAAGMGG